MCVWFSPAKWMGKVSLAFLCLAVPAEKSGIFWEFSPLWQAALSAPCRNPSSWQITQKEQLLKAQQRHLVQQKMVSKSFIDPFPSPPPAISTPLLRQSPRNFCPCSVWGFCWHSPAQQPVGQTGSTAAYAMLVCIMRSLLPRAHVLCKAGKKVMSVAGRNIMPCYSS